VAGRRAIRAGVLAFIFLFEPGSAPCECALQESMSSSINKRNKEKQRQERRREKEVKRQQRRDQKDTRAEAEPGVDPDIAGIIPGPQPVEPDPT
jgi:hypothetical protein